ncbi:MAG: acetyl-CoA carboxylase biotin carboxylase subunit [Rhodothalassiaceae bacterium]
MFSKILIANRGEIACRIIKTCRRLKIKTVAVYSDADADALHVDMADEAVHLGPPPAAQSYLLADKIIQAAKDTGAEAIHPGFGFLSEKADFVRAVDEAGLVFIGPPADAIAAMGDKIESKKLAKQAGVSTVPGHIGEIADAAEAQKIAAEIGYPVMIKASAGGGGKGMRIAYSDAEVSDGFTSARNEARSSFGDDRVFIEKFVEQPRHIEIQVLGDTQGNVIHLGERECSIQRRHQKIIEEAPSPFLDEQTRTAMGAQAVALSKAVGYVSAGTVEFIVDKDRNFYFLEMNTRLQVEHPVTEKVTGLDLVEQMIRIAAGEPLPLDQDEVFLNGWAIEARVYAEDPFRGFLPSIGRLTRYRAPKEDEHVRIDTGVDEGSEITLFYDPMIAKLVTYGEDRDEAIEQMRRALGQYYIRGIQHNIPFLAAVMDHPRFVEGRLTTGFIAEEYPDGFNGVALDQDQMMRRLAAAVFIAAICDNRLNQIEGRVQSGRPIHQLVLTLMGEHDGEAYQLDAQLFPTDAGARIKIGAQRFDVTSPWLPGHRVFTGEIEGEPVTLEADRSGTMIRLSGRGAASEIRVLPQHIAPFMAHMPDRGAEDSARFLNCPMPGLMISVAVKEGDAVEAGQPLCVVEAMKMENILRAERAGVVKSVKAKPGDSLAVDEVIMEFEAQD